MKKVNIKKVREVTGLTNIQIADKIGCSPQWLTNAERVDMYSKTLKIMDKLIKLSGLTYEGLTCENTEDYTDTELWIERVIDSCVTDEQLEHAYRLKANYKRRNK